MIVVIIKVICQTIILSSYVNSKIITHRLFKIRKKRGKNFTNLNMSEPSKQVLTNAIHVPSTNVQGDDSSNSNSKDNPENQEMSKSNPGLQQQSIIQPIQSIPIQSSEENFNANNQQYANFIQNNFAMQAAAVALQHPQILQQHGSSKNKNSKANQITMNQVLTSISSFPNFCNFNPAQPNALAGTLNGLTFNAKKAISRHKFSIDEDNLLRRLVNEHGTTNWRFIADNMAGRNARQCRDRWKNYLMPGIKNAPWTPEEDQLLEEKYAALGSQWSRIAKFFPNRTDINVKNRWATRNGRVNKAQPIVDMHNANINDNALIVKAEDSYQRPSVSGEIPIGQKVVKTEEIDANNNQQTGEDIVAETEMQNDDGGGK